MNKYNIGDVVSVSITGRVCSVTEVCGAIRYEIKSKSSLEYLDNSVNVLEEDICNSQKKND